LRLGLVGFGFGGLEIGGISMATVMDNRSSTPQIDEFERRSGCDCDLLRQYAAREVGLDDCLGLFRGVREATSGSDVEGLQKLFQAAWDEAHALHWKRDRDASSPIVCDLEEIIGWQRAMARMGVTGLEGRFFFTCILKCDFTQFSEALRKATTALKSAFAKLGKALQEGG